MNRICKPPYLGGNYYPEDWDVKEIDHDIAMMKEAGVNVARIAEFAWRKMEPKEGQYEWDWLHHVVDKLGEAGIGVIMGTPTATPPIWLAEKYPDMLTINEEGHQTQHGGRRHCCSHNPHYLEYSAKIVEAMAKEFGQDPNIIGWQLDNEIYIQGKGCYCEYCVAEFHKYLEAKYVTIDNLNAQWNLNLFSQAYDRFDQIPAPALAWHNPHLLQEWQMFQGMGHVNYIHMQYDILKPYVGDTPIGTDMMPVNGVDYEAMNEKLDILQFNHYNIRENLWQTMFWFDFLRSFKDRPFWNTETSTSWNGSTAILQTMKPEGFCRINSLLPIALGGELNCYWIWRTHWAGHELVHGAVLNPNGTPFHIFNEVQDVANTMEIAGDFFRDTKVVTDVAMHFTSQTWNMFQAQTQVSEFRYSERLMEDFYHPVVKSGLRPDVIAAGHKLDDYKLILSPLMFSLEDQDLQARMAKWVEEGGTWIVGPFSDARNAIGARYTDRAFGILEELTGIKCLYQIPDREHLIHSRWMDGSAFAGNIWCDVFDAPEENTLVKIVSGHSALVGKSLIIEKKVGKGHVIVLGTFPSEQDMIRILAHACDLAGVERFAFSGEVMAVKRAGNGHSGMIVMECGAENASIMIDKPMKNILDGKIYSGTITLAPYEMLILED